MINIAGQLHAATDEGVLVSSAEVKDETQNKSQAQINAELYELLNSQQFVIADLSMNLDNYGVGFIATEDKTILVGYIRSNTDFQKESESIIGCSVNYICTALFDKISDIPYTNQQIDDALVELKHDLYEKVGMIWMYYAVYAKLQNDDEKVAEIYDKVLDDTTKSEISFEDYQAELQNIIDENEEEIITGAEQSTKLYILVKTKSLSFAYTPPTDFLANQVKVNIDNEELDVDGQIIFITSNESVQPFVAGKYVLFPVGEWEPAQIDSSAQYIRLNTPDGEISAYRYDSCDMNVDSTAYRCFAAESGKLFFISNQDCPSIDSDEPTVNSIVLVLDRRKVTADGVTIIGAGNGITFESPVQTNTISFTVVYIDAQYCQQEDEELRHTYTETAEEGMTFADFVDSQYNPHEEYRDYQHCGYERSEHNPTEGINNYFTAEDEGTIDFRYDKDLSEIEAGDEIVLQDGHTYYYYSCPTCLLGDTLVTMADGSTRQIKDIRKGDKVLSLNLETGEQVTRTVIFSDAAMAKHAASWDEWEFEDGTVIKTAHRHEFFNVEKGKFAYLDEWEIGQHTYKQDGTTPALIKHTIHQEMVNHYKITLEGSTNFFANGLLTGDRYCNNSKITLK